MHFFPVIGINQLCEFLEEISDEALCSNFVGTPPEHVALLRPHTSLLLGIKSRAALGDKVGTI